MVKARQALQPLKPARGGFCGNLSCGKPNVSRGAVLKPLMYSGLQGGRQQNGGAGQGSRDCTNMLNSVSQNDQLHLR